MSTSDPGDWWPLGEAGAIQVGEVRLSGWDGKLARARARFAVPRIQPGRYSLMFCDAGCANPLGDIVPAGVSIVADPFIAQLARRLYRLESRSSQRVRGLRRALQNLQAEALPAPESPDVSGIVERLEALERRVSRPQPAADAVAGLRGWFVSGAVLAAAVSVLVGRARARRGRRADIAPLTADVPTERPSVWPSSETVPRPRPAHKTLLRDR